MSEYDEDRSWSDRYLPLAREIVGKRALIVTDFEADTRRAADLAILSTRGLSVGVRMRRPGFIDRYPFEFTIRSERTTGTQTELDKICNGLCDWMFYGHAGEDIEGRPHIARWMIIDLASWRAHMIKNKKIIGFIKKDNGDGTFFLAFDVRRFPDSPPILIDSSHDISKLRAAS